MNFTSPPRVRPLAVPFSEEQSDRLILKLSLFSNGVFIVVSQSDLENVIAPSPILLREFVAYSAPIKEENYTSLEEVIFTYPFLTFGYDKVFVRFFSTAFVTIPPELSEPEKNAFWMGSAFHYEGSFLGGFDAGGAETPQVAAAWYREAFNFLRRTYAYGRVEPLIAVAIARGIQDSKRMESLLSYTVVDEDSLDLLLFKRGKLLFSNHFRRIPFPDLPEEERLVQQVLFFWTGMVKTLEITEVVGDKIKLFLLPESSVGEKSPKGVIDTLTPLFREMGVILESCDYTEL